jgi:hypothetical protein
MFLAGAGRDRSRPDRLTRGTIRLSLACTLFSLVLLAAPALARATFTFVGTLSAAGQNADDPQVAVDADGDAVFVWRRFDGSNFLIQARARSAGGTLSAVQTLSAAGQSAIEPQVAVDADGDAIFVWARFDGTTQCGGFSCLRIQARARSAAGTLSGIQNISPAALSSEGPQVGVDSDGDAVFVWSSNDNTTGCEGISCKRIQARARTAGGALSTFQTLGGPSASISKPQVGVDSDGDAVFAWERKSSASGCDGPCGVTEARARSAGGTLSTTQILSAGPLSLDRPELDVGPTGNAVFVFRFFDVTTDCGGGASCAQVRTRSRTAGGALSTVQILSAPNRQSALAEVGVDSVGNAVFTWRLNDGTTECIFSTPCERIQARARSAGGTLSVVKNLSATGEDADFPEVGVDSDGDAVFVWTRFDGTNIRVQARSRSSAGTLSAVQSLSSPGENGAEPQVGVAPNGAAVAAWRRLIGSNDRIQAAVQPPPS